MIDTAKLDAAVGAAARFDAGPNAYRGYVIVSVASDGKAYISKDGAHLGWARTRAEAESMVDGWIEGRLDACLDAAAKLDAQSEEERIAGQRAAFGFVPTKGTGPTVARFERPSGKGREEMVPTGTGRSIPRSQVNPLTKRLLGWKDAALGKLDACVTAASSLAARGDREDPNVRRNWGWHDGRSARERGARLPEWARSHGAGHPTDKPYGEGFWAGWYGEQSPSKFDPETGKVRRDAARADARFNVKGWPDEKLQQELDRIKAGPRPTPGEDLDLAGDILQEQRMRRRR